MHSSFDPAYFPRLFAIEDQHFWFRARNQVIAAAIEPIAASLSPGYRILEAGCGTGNVLRTLEASSPGGNVIGLDPFHEALQIARRRTSVPLIQGDVCVPPFSEPFQIIGLFDVLEHLEEDVEVLGEIRNLLAPDGALLVTVPAHRSLWSYFDEASRHVRRYEEGELGDKLEQAGYRVEYLTQYMATIFPLVWAGRKLAALLKRSSPKDDRTTELASDELRIVPLVNPLLAFVLGQEARFVARRWRLPFGTSLLAVARKQS